ncbi:ABC transporter ATP-binding protein [Bacillus sp. T3]|uniref:ABC transporter ATP-binding protein n=1 Tax=Bacillus sp. T3 TaxID=467262 RepID=UPI002980DC25|nr:ABC transporter ATP-binding protein [Bacillus sp. T3]
MNEILTRFIRPYWLRLSLVLVLSIVGSVLFILQPLVGKMMIDEVFIRRSVSFEKVLFISILLLLLTYIISAINRFIYMKTSLQMTVDMRMTFYKQILKLPLQVLAKRRIGDLTTRLNEDIGEIQRLYTDSVLQLINLCLTLLFSMIVLMKIDWFMTLLCSILLPILLWVTHTFRNLLYIGNMQAKEIGAMIQSFLYESLSSQKFIRAGSLYTLVEKKYHAHLEKMNKQTIKLAIINTSAQGAPQILVWLSTLMLIWFLGNKVLEGTLTLGSLLAFTAYQANLFSSVQGLAQLYTKLQSGKAAVSRIKEFFHYSIEQDGHEELAIFHSSIEFNGVDFSYDGHQSILKDITFTISKGEKLAIIGESGSGKSTIVDLLARIYRPSKGMITCDGVDIQSVKKASWHQQICLISCDDPIWSGSIADFLRTGNREATENQIEKLLNDMGFWDDEKLLAGGLYVYLSEQGRNLSAGQKQRLQLVRALLQNPEILILDEATSHLDTESEQKIFSVLQEKMKNKTVIVITHRMQNIDWVDRSILIEQGQMARTKEMNWDGRLA